MSHIKCNLAPKFSIITLSETWLTPSYNSKLFKIVGFQTPFRRDREAINGPIGYGGVLAWVSNNIACKRREDLELPNIEAMWLEIRSANNKFYLCVTYRTQYVADYWDILQANINLVKEIRGAKILLVGDMNADPDTAEGRKLIDFCYANHLSTHVSEPTRITPESQTILDQLITNMPQMIKSVSVTDPVSTNDHCTISANLLFRKRRAHPYKRTMWDFKGTDFSNFKLAIERCNWEECFTDDNIETATEMWTNKLLNIAKQTIPNKEVTVRPDDKPWYNNMLRRLCRKKERLHKKAKQYNTLVAWATYREARNNYTSELSKAKESYDKRKYDYLRDEKTPSKRWWSVLKEMQQTNDAFESIPPLEIGEDIVTDDKDKAKAFNDFFLEASTLDDTLAQIPEGIMILEGGLDQIDITLQDVIDQVRCLDTSKSYGPDNISPRFLREGGAVLMHSLLRLYGMSLRLCKVPKLWKQANVVPIHKKESQSICTNYRPVSLLSVVGKTFERIVFKYVFNFFRENFILSIYQSGFLPGRSTVTQLVEVYNFFCKAVDDGKEIRVVFLDISKAFDKVWRKGLIYKLQRCGIHGQLLAWFMDYLSERMQRVVINGHTSEWGQTGAGVPQGSVLGPLLFLIYIDDLVHTVRHCNIRLFADDTCLFIEVDDRDETTRLLNQDLAAIEAWSHDWLVSFSASKTKALTISNRPDAELNPKVTFKGKHVEEVTSHTYLGLRFANNLRWKAHIEDIALKARRKLSLMIPLKMRMDRYTLEVMYRSFVLPTMMYACIVWGGSYDSDMQKLETIHIDAMRLITGATARSNINNVMSEYGGNTISDHIKQATLVMFFKIYSRKAPQYLIDILDQLNVERNYILRNENNVRIPYCRLESYKRSFFPRAIGLWNDLSNDKKAHQDVESFKASFKIAHSELKVLYYYGERWPAVHHARMRIGCSKLHGDLFASLHVIDSPACDCGANNENAEHFFLHCPLFDDSRETLISDIQDIIPIPITIKSLLFGCNTADISTNKLVFDAVHQYILNTKRFE